MYYVIVDNNEVTSVLGYEPAVPDNVTVVQITDEDYINLTEKRTHFFDIDSLGVVSYSQEKIDLDAQIEQQRLANAEKREFLNSTDWKILRHLRQKALNSTTTLTDEEYLELERQRAAAAEAITNQ